MRQAENPVPGLVVEGEPGSDIGILVEVDHPDFSLDVANTIEADAVKAINFIHGIRATVSQGILRSKWAAEFVLSLRRLLTQSVKGSGSKYPRLKSIGVRFIWNRARLVEEAGEGGPPAPGAGAVRGGNVRRKRGRIWRLHRMPALFPGAYLYFDAGQAADVRFADIPHREGGGVVRFERPALPATVGAGIAAEAAGPQGRSHRRNARANTRASQPRLRRYDRRQTETRSVALPAAMSPHLLRLLPEPRLLDPAGWRDSGSCPEAPKRSRPTARAGLSWPTERGETGTRYSGGLHVLHTLQALFEGRWRPGKCGLDGSEAQR